MESGKVSFASERMDLAQTLRDTIAPFDNAGAASRASPSRNALTCPTPWW